MCLDLVIGCDIVASKKGTKKTGGKTKKKKSSTATKNNKKKVVTATKKTTVTTKKPVSKSSKPKKKVKKNDSIKKIKKNINKTTKNVKTKLNNYKKTALKNKISTKEENARKKEELKSVSKGKKTIDYKLFGAIFVLAVFVILLLILFNNDKNKEIKLEDININSYMDLYKNKDTNYIYITMNNCTYCELLDPYIERLQTDYKIKFNTLNISELDEEEMNKLILSNSVFNDDWDAPLLISIKDGKEISNVKGYKEYSVLKRFVEYSSNPNDSTPFTKISIDKYLNLLNSKELSIIYIGRPDSNGCEVFVPILNKVTSEKNLKVYYLNTDILDTTEKWDKLNNSNEIFKGVWFTPTTLIVKDAQIIDYKMESMDEETLLYFFRKNDL